MRIRLRFETRAKARVISQPRALRGVQLVWDQAAAEAAETNTGAEGLRNLLDDLERL